MIHHFANEALAKRSDGRLAVWPVTGQTSSRRHQPDGCRLVRDGNTAAVPPIAAAPEFGGIGKMKESSRIQGHSNDHVQMDQGHKTTVWRKWGRYVVKYSEHGVRLTDSPEGATRTWRQINGPCPYFSSHTV